MLIPDNSYLAKLDDQRLSERERFFFEAIAHIFKTIEYTQLELVDILRSNPESIAEIAMSRVWSLIDNYQRLNKILAKTPKLKKRKPYFQLFIRKLKAVEEVRHFHQHIDNEIDNLLQNTKPMLGHLSWVEVTDNKTVKISTLIPGFLKDGMWTDAVNPIGRELINKIDLITYFIGDLSVELSSLAYSSYDFLRALELDLSRTE